MKKISTIIVLICSCIMLTACTTVTSDDLYDYSQQTYSVNRNKHYTPSAGKTFGDKAFNLVGQKLGLVDSIVENNIDTTNSIVIKDKQYGFTYTVVAKSAGFILDKDKIDLNYTTDIESDFLQQYLDNFINTEDYKSFEQKNSVVLIIEQINEKDRQILLLSDTLKDTTVLDFVKILKSYDTRNYFENYSVCMTTDTEYIVYYLASEEFE